MRCGRCVLVSLLAAAAGTLAAQTPDGTTALDPSLYQALRYRVIGPFRASRTVGAVGHSHTADRLLHGRQQRRRVEDRRLRPHVGAHLRRGADRLGRRPRRLAVPPGRHLRRQRRGPAPARSRRRRRHLQVDRRRAHVDARRPPRRPAGRPPRRPPDRPRHRLRRRHGPSVRTERGTRRVPHDERRPHVGEGAVRRSATPAPRRSRSIRPTRTRSTRRCGNTARARGRTGASAGRTAACTSRPTAARRGASCRRACRRRTEATPDHLRRGREPTRDVSTLSWAADRHARRLPLRRRRRDLDAGQHATGASAST